MDEGEDVLPLLRLPYDVLLHVLSFLDFRDLIRCSVVGNQLNSVANYDLFWKSHCRIHWDVEVCPESSTWKETFIHWYRDFGRYMPIYRKVRKAWNMIEAYMKENCPNVFASLRDGASEEELNETESRLEMVLPDDLRCVYRIHDGQLNREPVGLFGAIENYNHFRNERMISAKEMIQKRDVSVPNGLVHISFCNGTRTSQFLCVSDVHGFTPGYIYSPENLHYNVKVSNRNYFVLGHNYLDWFSKYAQELADKKFPLVKFSLGNCIYKFYHEPGCVAVTHNVRVSVATAFIPEMSTVKPPHFTFAYRITMSMDAGVSRKHSCRLETRHWMITDSNGKTTRVDGPGVIGEYPVMKPGAEYHYISCTNFQSERGEMSGAYTFRNLMTSETVDVEVPVFHMECPPIQAFTERE
jgi:F-box protein 3